METINRAYAAFIKNTIDPILDKLVDLKDYAEKKDIEFTKESLSELIEKAFIAHFVIFLIDWFFKLIVTSMIIWTVIKVL